MIFETLDKYQAKSTLKIAINYLLIQRWNYIKVTPLQNYDAGVDKVRVYPITL